MNFLYSLLYLYVIVLKFMIMENITNWGCGSVNNYRNKVNNLFEIYKINESERKLKQLKKPIKKPGFKKPIVYTNTTFKSIPVAIFADYDCSSCYEKSFRTGKEKINYDKYSAWIYEKIISNELTINTIAQLWHDYDAEKSKNEYLNINKTFKNLDYSIMFNKYDFTDFSVINSIKKNPFSMFYYTNKHSKNIYNLANDEREFVRDYYSQEKNIKRVNKLLEKELPNIMKYAPTIHDSIKAYENDLFADYCKCIFVDGISFSDTTAAKIFKHDNNGNFTNVFAKSLHDIIVTSINEAFKTDENIYKNYVKGIHILLTDTGKSDTEYGPIVSSSFSTTYKRSINVKLYVYPNVDFENDKPVFDKTFDNVVSFVDYYSGGWD